MNENKVTCKEVMNHICNSLGEELNSPKCVEIKSHLDECPDCRQYFNSVEKTIEFYKLYNMEFNPDVHNRLMDILGLEE